MKSRVISLPDLAELKVKPEYFVSDVPDEAIDELIATMQRNFGDAVETEKAGANCCLICVTSANTPVYLYPYMEMPGVEIETDLTDVGKGSAVNVTVNGVKFPVTVQKIVVNRPVSPEELIEKIAIPDVSDLDGLKAYLRKQEADKNKDKNLRSYVWDMHDYLVKNAVCELDEEEVSAWTGEQARAYYDQNLAVGIDLRFTDDGTMLSEEEVLKQLTDEMRPQLIGILVDRKYADERGYETDEAAVRAAVLEEMKTMGMDDPGMLEENLKNAIENDAFGFVFNSLMNRAKEVLA